MFYDRLKQMASAIKKPRLAKTVMSPDEIVNALKNRFGNVKVSRGCNGTELLTKCPFCGRSEKLSVNPGKRVYHCWHCDSSGTLSKLLGVDVSVSEGPMAEAPEPKEHKTVYPPSFDPSQILPLSCLPEDNPAIIYLRSRGFDPVELDRDFAFRYCAKGRSFPHVPFDASNTLIIPIYSEDKFLGWQARLLYDPKSVSEDVLLAMGYTARKESGGLKRPPKYLTSPGLNKKEMLYNVDWAKRFDTVVVTEGVFDCIRVGRQGVATLGKLVSDYQKKMLLSLWKTIVLLLDPDASETQRKLVEELTIPGGPRIVPVTLEGYKDAGDCPRDELWKQINAALAQS
jgi:DNA primase